MPFIYAADGAAFRLVLTVSEWKIHDRSNKKFASRSRVWYLQLENLVTDLTKNAPKNLFLEFFG